MVRLGGIHSRNSHALLPKRCSSRFLSENRASWTQKSDRPTRNDRIFEMYQQKPLGLAESCGLVSVAADRLGGAGSAAAALMGASSEEESSRSKDGDSKNSFHENRFE